MKNLEQGKVYGFSVIAYNFNGAGDESTVAYFKPCQVPSGLATPEIISTTESELALLWAPPQDDGACPILGYVLYFDDGDTNSDFVAVDTDAIANKDYLRSHTVTFQPAQAGLTFRYILEAINEIGSATSPIGS